LGTLFYGQPSYKSESKKHGLYLVGLLRLAKEDFINGSIAEDKEATNIPPSVLSKKMG
jgi:hypothetical protein